MQYKLKVGDPIMYATRLDFWVKDVNRIYTTGFEADYKHLVSKSTIKKIKILKCKLLRTMYGE